MTRNWRREKKSKRLGQQGAGRIRHRHGTFRRKLTHHKQHWWGNTVGTASKQFTCVCKISTTTRVVIVMRTPSAYACTEYYRQHALFQLSNDVNSVQGGPKRAAGPGALGGTRTKARHKAHRSITSSTNTRPVARPAHSGPQATTSLQHQTCNRSSEYGGRRRWVEERSVRVFRRLRRVYSHLLPAVRDGRLQRREGRQELLSLRLPVAARLHRHLHARRRQDANTRSQRHSGNTDSQS